MKTKLEYSFDDEPVQKFCYDLGSKKIEIHFNGFYDLNQDKYIKSPCVWSIGNWVYGKSKIGDDQKTYDLTKHMGVFSLILYLKYNEDKELEMLVNTIDDRYITFLFKDPDLSLK